MFPRKLFLLIAAMLVIISLAAVGVFEERKGSLHGFTTGMAASDEFIELPNHLPLNVIIMIAEGMSFMQMQAAGANAGHKELLTDRMPVSGSLSVPDTTGISAGGRLHKGLVDYARRSGRRTGIITTDSVTGDTSAALYARRPLKGGEAEMALQLINSEIDLVWGGGYGYFIPHGRAGSLRNDKTDLLSLATGKGFAVSRNISQAAELHSLPSLGLFAHDGFSGNPAEPSLAEMIDHATGILAGEKRGFFLFVEGGLIKREMSGELGDNTIDRGLEFQNAVTAALKFAEDDGDTLVIVTTNPASFSQRGRLEMNVPLFAFGPGSKPFTGRHGQNYVEEVIIRYFTTIDKYIKILVNA